MPDTFRYIKARSIKPGQNPRTYFDQKEHDEMVESIKAQGVIQPINVRPSDDAYEIIAGERRWRAALEISNDFEIPCMIRTVTDDVALTMAVIENKDRSHMSATEEAAGAEKLLQTYKGDREEVARVLGWSRSTLDKRLALMHCTPEVRKALDERSILLGHAELLAAVPHDKQNTSLATIIGQKLDINTVRKALAQKANKIDSACFDREDCLACQYNSAQQRALFEAVIDDGYCTNAACYEQKTTAYLDALKTKLSEDVPNVRVIQAGDENASVMLMMDGNLGVGEVQAAACRTCANFGCTISALPGHVGEIERDICFDPACNQKMVAARIKAEKASSQPANVPGAVKQGKATETGKGKTKTAGDSKPTALRQGLMDYRNEVWRKMLANDIFAHKQKAIEIMLALGLTHRLTVVDSGKFREKFPNLMAKLVSVDLPGQTSKPAAVNPSNLLNFNNAIKETGGIASNRETSDSFIAVMVACAAFGLEISEVETCIDHLGCQVERHWKADKAFFELLTKSEIEGVCTEIGLKIHLGSGFAKLFAKKKDDLVQTIMATDGFDFAGKVPGFLKPPTRLPLLGLDEVLDAVGIGFLKTGSQAS